MARCRACGAELEWVRTEAGKAMPLDPGPAAEGNVVIRADRAVVLGPLEVAAVALEGVEVLRLAHFVTCPNWGAR